MKKSPLMLIGGAVALILVVGIALVGMKPSAALPADMATHLHENTIPGAGAMPTWLADAPNLVKTEYVWAAAHLDELQYIPCYCGCGPDSPFGHTDNFACYFERDSDGNILALDSHGFG